MAKQLIRTSEAAKRLDVHQTTIQRWIKDGHLQARKKGPGRTSPYLVDEKSVEDLVTQLQLQLHS